MTLNGIFATLGNVIIFMEFLALFALCVLSYQRISCLLFGGYKNITTEEDAFLHSCFITVLSVAVFHLTTSTLRDIILAMPLEKMELRQVFYAFLFFMEFLFIVFVYAMHKIRRCKLSKVARIAILLALIMCANQLLQYYIRGMLGLDFYMPFYKGIILLINLATLTVISIYPIASVLKLKKQY
jgi:hypothetical protein